MLLLPYLYNNDIVRNNPVYMISLSYKSRCVSKLSSPIERGRKNQNTILRGYATSLPNSSSSKNTESVCLAQILMNSSCQINKRSDIKNFDSPSSNSFENIAAKRNSQHFIDMHLHFKSILEVLYLLCNVLQNKGTIYVVGYKPEVLVSSSFFKKSFKELITLPKNKNIKKLRTKDHNKEMLVKKGKSFEETQYEEINLGIGSIFKFPKLETGEENWCASSLSNWRKKSDGFWRIARFLIQLQDFALQNGDDFYQLRKKHASLVSQLITVKKQNFNTEANFEQDFYMPFFRKPDLLVLFNAESKRSVLKQAKSLQIPTVAICYSKEIAKEALYSLPGNYKSIHLLYRLLDSFSLLSVRT